jgi:hypothetical protein
MAWSPDDGTTDVIGVEYAGEGEDFRGRTLAVYESEAAATAALDTAATVLADCPEEPSQDESGVVNVHEPFDAGLDEQSVAWTLRYHQPDAGAYDTGATVYVLARVGAAVYASFEYSEAGEADGSLDQAIQHATDQARPIVEAMHDL